ncbi:NADH-quinone oxidoreductase subunit H [Streptomyces albidoflavus]|uniref:NADH-quinone oxidoreductase subunit H n=1 Tax=Streptomyces albidoflavus TaxID=1886 RepID=UPI00101E7AEE|nr:NADH-quinone oxidoreductase subunit H [Streptomyces albidoflavus]RZD88744.1 NADH-quinone oxidoreductase subunit H [Streptomyces albidoflavus]RZE04402.1 NADH-quinone oxidoreductase subunit H [Streptomyces albidoflavus]
MADSAPLWAAAALPLLLAPAALAVACADGRSAAPVREVLRLLVQQPRRTRAADALATRAGTVLLPLAAVLAAAVVPLGATPVSDLGDGVVWFNAMEALAWAAVWLTGWGPNSALSLVGGYRFLAQGLAYEIPHMLALTTAALGAGSLRVTEIADAQRGLWFAVWMPAAFALYLLSAAAMSFWGPFGQPAGRDLAGGVATELTGVGRLLLLGGRRLLLLTSAAMAVPLFLGGGHGPLLPGWAWTLVKTGAVLALLLWLRRRLPGVRMDRYTELSWVVLTPLAVLQALVVAVVVLP